MKQGTSIYHLAIGRNKSAPAASQAIRPHPHRQTYPSGRIAPYGASAASRGMHRALGEDNTATLKSRIAHPYTRFTKLPPTFAQK